jgi:hypothetical protein
MKIQELGLTVFGVLSWCGTAAAQTVASAQ